MKGTERFIAVFDNHGNKAVPHVIAAALRFAKDFKPTVRIHGGDCFNFAALRKGATDEEKREKIRDDIDAGADFVKRFKPTHWLRGNHDERLYDALGSDDGKLADFASFLTADIDEAFGDIPVFPYCKRKGVMTYGDHKVLHGYNAGMYAARHAAMAYGSLMMGHVHAHDEQSVPRFDRATGHSSGCLCELQQTYNRGHLATLRQDHGWLYGLNVRGRLLVWHAKHIDGRWYLPSEIREIQ